MGQKAFGIVLGNTSRSRNGCSNCKRSKKKCDESFPVCGLCAKRNVECKYEIFRDAKIKKTESHKIKSNHCNKVVKLPNNKPIVDKLNHELNSQDITNGDQSESTEDKEVEGEIYNQDSARSPTLSEIINNMTDSDFDLTVQPTSTFNLYLDETGIQFLRYFETNVSTLLTLDTNSQNYFIKTFLQMSLTEESISHALACWGGVFKESKGLEDEKVKKHLNRSLTLIKDLNYQSSINVYILLAFYQILIGIQVCSGDVKNWYTIFQTCNAMIRHHGGIGQILIKFNYCNDIKWLVSNHEYHDILNSRTFKYGSFFKIDDYNNLSFFNYGVDPYQGCHNSVIVLLGEVLNARVGLTNLTLNEIRIKYMQLLNKLDKCEPIKYQLNLLNEESKINHLNCFKIYKLVTKIILLVYFKKLNPSSLDIQLLTIEGLELLEILVRSNFVASLSFPFLIIGINAIGDERQLFMDLVEKTYSFYTVGNLRRVIEFVKLYWRKNNGDKYLDWVDVTEELGWELCLC